mgnify:FL=1
MKKNLIVIFTVIFMAALFIPLAQHNSNLGAKNKSQQEVTQKIIIVKPYSVGDIIIHELFLSNGKNRLLLARFSHPIQHAKCKNEYSFAATKLPLVITTILKNKK